MDIPALRRYPAVGPVCVEQREGCGLGRQNVSVIMPVLNSVTTVGPAIASILAEPEVAELIVVDDGSTDGSREVIEAVDDPRLRLIDGPKAGLAPVYNRGMFEATSDYIAFCDHDDFYSEGRFAWQTEFLDANPDYVAVAGAFATTDMDLRVQVPLDYAEAERDTEEELRNATLVSHINAWLIRRETAFAVGGRRNWFEVADDLDLQFRIGGQGKVRFVPKVTYVHRLNSNSVTHTLAQARMDFFDNAAKRFALQRRDGGEDDLQRGEPPAYNVSPDDARRRNASLHIAGHLMSYAHVLRSRGEYGEALRNAGWAVRMDARNPDTWRTYLGILRHRVLHALGLRRVAGRDG